jgi:hypothetical protein
MRGRAHRGARVSGRRRQGMARGRTLASFQWVLDGGDAMMGIRTTGQARERGSPPRLLPDEGVEDGWRSFGHRCTSA